jgi:hypothetical protein
MWTRKVLLVLPLMAIVLSGCNRNTASRSNGNLKLIALAAMKYADANQEHFPDMYNPAAVKTALLPYVDQTDSGSKEDIFVNPSTGRPYQSNSALSNIDLADISDPSVTILFYEDAPYDDGMRGVIYADGHYVAVPESSWSTLSSTQMNPVQTPATPSY